MDNQEMLEALQRLIREEIAPIKDDISEIRSDINEMKLDISGTKVIIDADIRRSIDLLGEGQQIIIDRLPDPEQAEVTEARLSALEISVRKLNKDMKELKKAQ